jgi:hypothetical protein
VSLALWEPSSTSSAESRRADCTGPYALATVANHSPLSTGIIEQPSLAMYEGAAGPTIARRMSRPATRRPATAPFPVAADIRNPVRTRIEGTPHRTAKSAIS